VERIRGELVGLCAMVDGVMVALALAERRSDGGAQLLSLMVAPSWRRRGIGTGLLLRLKPVLAAEGIAPVEVRYVANALTTSALEPILERLGWEVPHTDVLLLEGHSSQLAAVGWSDRHPLQAPYSLVAWGQLSDLQRHATTGLGAPAAGHPATQEHFQPDPQLSLVLLHHDEPVGWVLVQRKGADSLSYASLFVAPAHRGRARGLVMLHAGFRRQHAAAIPMARAAIASDNAALVRLVHRHLGVHLQAIGQSRISRSPG
jgi:hypothetical protein